MERTKEEEHLTAALELGLRLGRGTPDGAAELPPSDEWSSFVHTFPQSSADAALSHLDKELAAKSVLSGNGFTLSQTDFAVYSTVLSSVIALPDPERQKFTNLLRWMSYIQSKVDNGEPFGRMVTEKPRFDFETPLRHLMSLQLSAKSTKPEADSRVKETAQVKKDAEKPKGGLNAIKNDAKGKATGKQEPGQDKKKQTEADKKKQTEAAVVEKDTELSVSLLNIQVGVIRKAWKHPSAESLLVEEIDVGDAKLRQVVSGLAKYCNPDELMNRRVVLITNVKPGKLRDVMSEGLVLCASNEDHSAVEPLLPPEGAKIGERISFSGIDGKPEDVLNPKKKQLEKITPNLFTDDKGVATFKGIPFMTSGGPITSSLLKATIK